MGAPFIIPGASLHREFQLLRESGLTSAEVLRSATAGPAQFLGKQAEFGTVSPGGRADLLLLDGNPLDDIARLDKPSGVMVRGIYISRAELDTNLQALATKN